MIVNNERDLKIVGVIDWEWSYAGPCQLFCSPPHWLLLDSPNYWFKDDNGVVTRSCTRQVKYWVEGLESDKSHRSKTPETEEECKAREAVNDSIADTKSSDMSRMMDAGRSSQKKRDDIKKEEEREEGERGCCQ
ncbi:hypothetical protein B0O99DRAFT_676005 [Bisporella sp. PMI_857]|nr:hypothetical protein B0O99DRAFT_676005 [Bisporella sp. PMI_857]